MKHPFITSSLVYTAAAALMTGLVVGCNSDQSAPPPLVDNSHKNALTERQRLVRQFHTAEVMVVPNNDTQFIVRDTNGAVWFVQSGRNSPDSAGITTIFGPKVPVPLMLEEPEPSLEDQKRQAAAVAIQTAADVAKVMLTNNAVK